MEQGNKLNFVTLYPKTSNYILPKDVGMITYVMGKHFNYNSKIVSYKWDNYTYLNNELKDLKMEYIDYSGDVLTDGLNYIKANAKNIDILHLYYINTRTFLWIKTYKTLNPKGKVYLKLDAGFGLDQIPFNAALIEALTYSKLVSVENKNTSIYISNKWDFNIEYLPNGWYDFSHIKAIEYKEKENVICTVTRIGVYEKACEILLEAFAIAFPYISNWQLRITGPIEVLDFKEYIKNFFVKYPHLQDKIIFTGYITDKSLLEKEYRKAKLFCLPSRSESFGIVLVEAERYGCYIICSNLPAAMDITDNKKYGDIFQKDNINELASLLINHCKNDLELRENCSKSQEFAKNNFSWVSICAKIDSYLRDDNYSCLKKS